MGRTNANDKKIRTMWHQGNSVEKIAEDIERDFFMSAQEGKEYGVVDHVMPNRK